MLNNFNASSPELRDFDLLKTFVLREFIKAKFMCRVAHLSIHERRHKTLVKIFLIVMQQ
jgi:hypothetical protein